MRHQRGGGNPPENLNTVSREHKIPSIALSKKLPLIRFLFHFNARRLPLTRHQRPASVYRGRDGAKF